MKRILAIAFVALLGFLALPVSTIVAPVSMTAAQACGTGGNASRSPHCNTPYLQTCASLGYRGPCGLGGNRAGNSGGQYGRGVVYGQPRIIRRPVPVIRDSYAVRYYGAAAASQTTATPPLPQTVYERQLSAGNVTSTRVPCADGFDLLPNGNCGRWVPN